MRYRALRINSSSVSPGAYSSKKSLSLVLVIVLVIPIILILVVVSVRVIIAEQVLVVLLEKANGSQAEVQMLVPQTEKANVSRAEVQVLVPQTIRGGRQPGRGSVPGDADGAGTLIDVSSSNEEVLVLLPTEKANISPGEFQDMFDGVAGRCAGPGAATVEGVHRVFGSWGRC